MNTYVALLRGINVSGQKKVRMTDLKNLFEKIGHSNVLTYIQSGNVIFNNKEQNSDLLEKQIEDAIFGTYGFQVHVIVKQNRALQSIVDQNPYTDKKDLEENKVYFIVLKKKPSIELVTALEAMHFDGEQFLITDLCVYLKCINGMGKAKCGTNFFEKKLEVNCTARNHRTMSKILSLASF